MVRVGAASLRTTPLDFSGNLARIQALLHEARQKAIDLLVLPELCLSGYECGDFFWHPWVAEAAWESLEKLASETQGIAAVVGLPLAIGGELYNAAAFVAEGRIWGFSLKRHLPHTGVFYEPRWFRPGPSEALTEPRSQKPAAFALPFMWRDFIVQIEICEDAWQPGRPLEQSRAHIALSLNASPFEMRKAARRRRLVTEASYRYHCVYAYANLLGNEAGKLLYEGEALIAWEGQLLSATPRFSYEEGALTWIELPESALKRASYKQSAPLPRQAVSVSESAAAPKAPGMALPSPYKPTPLAEEPWEELTEAIAMGLWDYLWKSRSRGFVVSLSGGLDSAACAVLAHLALRWAQERLPEALYRQRLNYLPSASSPVLYTFYQATAQSSVETYQRAKRLAEEVGLPFYRWDLQDLVEAYEHRVAAWLGRALSWEQDDIPRQNLQARVRVPGLWMAANLLGALLLTTSNRSELSTGYSTMDGDSAGGVAPIAGIAKSDLKAWALWAAERFGWPSLRDIAEATPTAELRPGPQADEADLMPYPILNQLEQQLIAAGESPSALRAHLSRAEQPPEWAEKFLHLFRISQWKRERAAPAFHVDQYDLDPRAAARFPILHALH